VTPGAGGAHRLLGRAARVAARWLERDALPPADHRPWPLPADPWVMRQTWEDLLFAHWPVPAEALRRLVPGALALDTSDGTAWLGITSFRLTGLRLRALPAVPRLSAFPELNVRTYVVGGGTPGVFFFSLDAGSRAAVAAARRCYLLPYFAARATLTRRAGRVRYESRREGAPGIAFAAEYAPAGPPARPVPGSLAAWLTERYCLYTVDAGGRVHRAEIHHEPWPLHPAAADITRNTMAEPLGLPLPGAPLLHFARHLDVHVWPLEAVETAAA
jgi:hypothetical protein